MAAASASITLRSTLRSSLLRHSSTVSFGGRRFDSLNHGTVITTPIPVQAKTIRHLSKATNHSFVLSHPSSVENRENSRGRIVCITSGKGGVGVSDDYLLLIVERARCVLLTYLFNTKIVAR